VSPRGPSFALYGGETTTKPKPMHVLLLALPLAAWFAGLALWLAFGGGFEAMRQAPFGPMMVMACGSIVVPVLSMSLAAWMKGSETKRT
jgi:hypothetical protein